MQTSTWSLSLSTELMSKPASSSTLANWRRLVVENGLRCPQSTEARDILCTCRFVPSQLEANRLLVSIAAAAETACEKKSIAKYLLRGSNVHEMVERLPPQLKSERRTRMSFEERV